MRGIGTKELGERLKTYYSTIGIVSVLTATMAFAGLLAQPNTANPPSYFGFDTLAQVQTAYEFFMVLSLIFSLLAVVNSANMFNQVIQQPSEEAAEKFFIRFSKFLFIPNMFMQFSLISLLVGVMIWIFVVYQSPLFWIVLSLST